MPVDRAFIFAGSTRVLGALGKKRRPALWSSASSSTQELDSGSRVLAKQVTASSVAGAVSRRTTSAWPYSLREYGPPPSQDADRLSTGRAQAGAALLDGFVLYNKRTTSARPLAQASTRARLPRAAGSRRTARISPFGAPTKKTPLQTAVEYSDYKNKTAHILLKREARPSPPCSTGAASRRTTSVCPQAQAQPKAEHRRIVSSVGCPRRTASASTLAKICRSISSADRLSGASAVVASAAGVAGATGVSMGLEKR